MIEAVLFDYGMVLSGPADPVAWSQMHQVMGIADPQFDEAYWAPRHAYDRGTHTGEEYWRLVGEHAGLQLTPNQLQALLDLDTALWTQPNQPMIDWAARLQAAGTKTGILSNLGDQITLGVQRCMPWLDQFHHCTFSHVLKLAKPEAEIYRHAAEGLEAKPEGILFVDDRIVNCEAGLAAGMQVIQYSTHQAFVREIEDRGLGRLWQEGKA